ncbi:MAG: response regulator [Desulfatiglans sp.]|jgi:PAS domain S-box-containing protein|nr:response regulator [Thermodesulfobacteriota bacterium]MEE4354341.1 response regulator [Desulfatiglans sp.]
MEKRPKKVLVVDDDPSICHVFAKVLVDEGYESQVCTNPFRALDLSKSETFALAFLDINMPDLNGLDLGGRIKENNPEQEIIFITGSGTYDQAIQALKMGAYDFLRKPCGVNEIKLCLKRFQEKEKLKEKIKTAEQRYFHLVQNIPVIIFVINKDLSLEFVNNACSSVLEYSPQEAVISPDWFLRIVHPDDRHYVLESFRSSFLSGGSPISIECRLIHKRGHSIHVIIKSISYYKAETDRRPDQLYGIVVDITDRVYLEKAIVQREKLNILGAISAEVAHEIRNPLVSIGGFSRRLKKKSPELQEANIILKESERLENILNRIENYLKPVEFSNQECDINSIVTYCVSLLSPKIEVKQIKCRLDLDPNQPKVYADPEILTQIIMNLIRNAAKAMEMEEFIDIATIESHQNVYVTFKNKTPERKKLGSPEHLFLPFDEDGDSIGIPLCYRMLKNMEGALSFTQDGDIMTFTISFKKI